MSDGVGAAEENALAPRRGRVGPFAARAAVTVALLGALFTFLPRDEIFAALARLSPWLWLGLLAGFLAGHAVSALKWRMLVRTSGVAAGVAESLAAHAAGLFANLCLPSLVGGDVVRAGALIRRHGRPEAVVVGGGADRLLDTAALVVIAGGALWFLPAASGGAARRWLGLAAVLLIVVPVAGFVLRDWLLRERGPERVRALLRSVRVPVEALARRPDHALAALALSVLVQTFFVALNVRLAESIGIAIAPAIWYLVWPLAKIAALLPVSLGGIGARETALAALLAPFGVAPAFAVVQGLIWETVLLAGGALAGLAALASGALGGTIAGESR